MSVRWWNLLFFVSRILNCFITYKSYKSILLTVVSYNSRWFQQLVFWKALKKEDLQIYTKQETFRIYQLKISRRFGQVTGNAEISNLLQIMGQGPRWANPWIIYIWSNYSDLSRGHPKWWFSKGNPFISGKSRLVKYYNLARYMCQGRSTPFISI